MSDKLEQAIVRIYGQSHNVVGTGVLVGERLILTCAHVIAQALFGNPQYMPSSKPKEAIILDFPIASPNNYLQGSIVCWIPMQPNGEGDIAVLELTSTCPDVAKPVSLVENTNSWGHTFKTFGCPRRYTNGLWVSGKIKGQQANGWLQIESDSTKSFDFGFSGGGVWDEQLKGISGIVVQMIREETSNVAYIIPTANLVANCKILKDFTIIPPKNLGELCNVPVPDLQSQLSFYHSRLALSKEDDLLAIALILLALKSFDEAGQFLVQLLRQNPMQAYVNYLYAVAKLKGQRPWLLNYNEAVQAQTYALKALQLDLTQAHSALLLALIKEDFFQRKGFRVEDPDLVSCIQTALRGRIIKEELLILLRLVPFAEPTSKVATLINTLLAST